jgi:hypothetical protein
MGDWVFWDSRISVGVRVGRVGLAVVAATNEGTRARDRDTVNRWARAEGTDLETEAERAKAKLRNVDQA